MSDTALTVYLHYGTNAQRLAFTPSPPSTGQPIYIWYESDTDTEWTYTTAWHQTSGSGGGVTASGTLTSGKVVIGAGTSVIQVASTTGILKGASGTLSAATSGVDYVVPWSDICQGRLTTESGVAVSTSDRTAQATIYFTPAIYGNAITNGQIALYNGSAVAVLAFTQLSLALSGLTSGKNHDVFVDYNSGTPQLVLSAAWSSDTARTDALGVQSGIIIKSGTAAYRWVGTIRTTGTTTTEDSAAKRFIWNAYNQCERKLKGPVETTDSWNYTTATWRQANSNTANQFEYVSGSASTVIHAAVHGLADNSGTAKWAATGIGIDSVTVNSADVMGGVVSNALSVRQIPCAYIGTPGLGYHYVAWLEYSNTTATTGTTTWYGDSGQAITQSGLIGTLFD